MENELNYFHRNEGAPFESVFLFLEWSRVFDSGSLLFQIGRYHLEKKIEKEH